MTAPHYQDNLVKLTPRPTRETRKAERESRQNRRFLIEAVALIRRRELTDADTTEIIAMLTGTK